jgi:hypothetical protein
VFSGIVFCQVEGEIVGGGEGTTDKKNNIVCYLFRSSGFFSIKFKI